MKAYQIVMIGDERSEEYAEISRKSFEPALDRGIIEDIITFPAITPDSLYYKEHVERFTWERSLMFADTIHDGKYKDDHSPTEKAGMCSHWELMRLQSITEERFFVMEHDTYLLDVDMFDKCVTYIESSEVMYANIGAFMGCYTFTPEVAAWQYDMLINHRFPINCGPYCTLQRLFATYTTRVLQDNNYYGVENTVIHPWAKIDTLCFSRNVQRPYNTFDPDPENNEWRTPTTQVISKRMNVTQHHHSYSDECLQQPWLRNKFFKVIG